ncbi:MAG: peptide chain release factor N(5)-glutamine methyltransferase [Planctomycetes bacterium]|nr:peptide chain release factor N(5)-glutamine methyltransferase [Planctomycetota bacterium]
MPRKPTETTARQGPSDEVWTTRRLLAWIADFLSGKGVDAPRLCAEMLLGHVLSCERTRLYMEADRNADAGELARLRELVRRAAEHEPVQYLVGETWFYAKPYFVDRSTLIPRPSTERMTELAVAWARESGRSPLRILDLCTGSGCVAVSVISALVTPKRNNFEAPAPAIEVSALATDLVPAALTLGTRNASRHGQEARIDFRVSDLFESIAAKERGTFDLITANPPYISDEEFARCAPNVRKYEPETALRGGVDGLRVVEPLLLQAAGWLRPGGRLLVEIAASQGAAVELLARSQPELKFLGVEKDGDGLDRILVADRK